MHVLLLLLKNYALNEPTVGGSIANLTLKPPTPVSAFHLTHYIAHSQFRRNRNQHINVINRQDIMNKIKAALRADLMTDPTHILIGITLQCIEPLLQ